MENNFIEVSEMEEIQFKCKLRVIFAEIKQTDKTFTQEKFAKKVGVTKGTLSALVNAHSLPTFIVACKIANELKKPIEEIWDIELPNDEEVKACE
jgi:putative transcriptional regulator